MEGRACALLLVAVAPVEIRQNMGRKRCSVFIKPGKNSFCAFEPPHPEERLAAAALCSLIIWWSDPASPANLKEKTKSS